MAWQIGADVGGTFTDLLALDPERGMFRVAKLPSTPDDQSVGFIDGLAVLKTDLAAVAALVHGTTVATNEPRLHCTEPLGRDDEGTMLHGANRVAVTGWFFALRDLREARESGLRLRAWPPILLSGCPCISDRPS
jgi:hypothetical protein